MTGYFDEIIVVTVASLVIAGIVIAANRFVAESYYNQKLKKWVASRDEDGWK